MPRSQKVDAADRALDHRDDDVALDRRAHHRGEAAEHRAVVLGAERHRVADVAADGAAVAEQEEQHVEHDAGAGDEAQRVLPEAERLGGEELADLLQRVDQPVAQGAEVVAEPEAREQHAHPLGQRRLDLLHQGRRVVVAGLDALDELRPLADQRPEDHHHRDDRDDDADQHAQHRREVAAAAEAALEGDLQRLEDDREDRRPEDRAVERQQQPAEEDRDQGEQQQESLVLERGVHRLGPPATACGRARLVANRRGWQGARPDHGRAAGLIEVMGGRTLGVAGRRAARRPRRPGAAVARPEASLGRTLMFKHVLIPTDGSPLSEEAEGPRARQGAGARATVMIVVEPFHLLTANVEQIESTRAAYETHAAAMPPRSSTRPLRRPRPPGSRSTRSSSSTTIPPRRSSPPRSSGAAT